MQTPPSSVKSQAFPNSAPAVLALREAISAARLGTYIRHAHRNLRLALDLYAWNAHAGAALHPLLQVNEITLRNAIDRALTSQFGVAWPYSAGFLRSLPRRDRTTFESCRSRLERSLRVVRATTGDVVAAQSYWFWVMLLNARFEQRIWSRELARSFPHAPPPVTRAVLYTNAEMVRRLRNRIAHHEPLLDYDIPGAYRRAIAMVRWISPAKAAWAARLWPAAGLPRRP
jgi:hypothetical protein